MNTNTATEYRNLPLAVLTESATNPRRIFEDSALILAAIENPVAETAEGQESELAQAS